MKEPFVNLDTLIQQTSLLSDMELQAYLASMSDSQKTDFVGSNVVGAINSVKAQKSSKFNDLFDQMIGADNNVTSAAYYLARTRDLTDFAKDVDDLMVKELNATDINAGLAARQNEINDWANFNKLDTLYIMQVLFVSLSMVGILSFLLANGTITQVLFTFVSYIIAALAVLMVLFRWRYTNVARDGRYWHKARFQKQPNTYIAPTCPTNGGPSFLG
jgi:flagellar biosynthesis protein FliQ